MQKQRNRGQDGVGVGCCKLDMPPGLPYMFRVRSMVSAERIGEVFEEELKEYKRIARRIDKEHKQQRDERGHEFTVRSRTHPAAIKREFEMAGEVYLGHLRYGTSGDFGKGCAASGICAAAPGPRAALMVMGNFNLTNTTELNEIMRKRGQHPVHGTDTQSVLEEIGFQLRRGTHRNSTIKLRDSGMPGEEIPPHISAHAGRGGS